MKNRNMISTITTVLLALGFAALCPTPKAFAVVPAPDGGYAGGNTAEGQSALLSRTTGLYNTAVGIYSVLSLTDGSFCTGVGAGTLLANTADENTATGAGALLSNTTGIANTANGAFALFSNTGGSFNTATGVQALFTNTGSEFTGFANTATGYQALFENTTGINNTASGYQALHSNTEGFGNTANGQLALFGNTTGNQNTAIGDNALLSNATGNFNTANGSSALHSNTEGLGNTAIGFDALFSNTTGQGNTAIGNSALSQNTTGGSNTALGFTAGSNVTTATDVICIGTGGANVDNSCYIGNIFNQTSSSGIPVLINSSNKLGTTTSSKRFKEDIKSMGAVSEALFSLTPVTFQYKKKIDPAGTPQLGLVAEDVEKVNPDLVVRDNEGKAYSVRYDQVNAMLLNEFLKEHHKVQEQQKEIEAVKTELKEQRELIQKVSERVAMGKAAPQIVTDNQ
jgi:hypothetical protein